MDTQFLETFLLVADQGSLAAAARRLGVTPAAVAQRIAVLEAEVGSSLLMRAGQRVQPTEAGHAIAEHSRRILRDVRELRLIARDDGVAGELRLGAISTVLTGILPRALRRLAEAAPGIELFILPGASLDLHRQLVEGRIDAALLVRPPFAIAKALDWQVLRRDPMVLICPEDWASETVEQLIRSRRFIRYDRNNWGGRLADGWMKSRRFAPREWLELDQLEAIAVMVSNGLGVSIVPDWAPPWPEGLRIARLPLRDPVPPLREIGLLWPRSSAARRLVGQLQAALA